MNETPEEFRQRVERVDSHFFEEYERPDIAPPRDERGYSLYEIEDIATAVRRHWGLGDGPIVNVIALFETHGIIVTRFELGSDEIDAFSCWIRQRPYILLGSDKKSCSRSRFDAAHELGHLLLHRHVGQEDLKEKSIRDHIEAEANMFAGAFLLPRNTMLREFYSLRSLRMPFNGEAECVPSFLF